MMPINTLYKINAKEVSRWAPEGSAFTSVEGTKGRSPERRLWNLKSVENRALVKAKKNSGDLAVVGKDAIRVERFFWVCYG